MRTSAPPPIRNHRSSLTRVRAFTLIELIVAVSVTSVLLLLVSRVFNETTKAINIGADTSQIVSNSRILSDQLFQDLSRINRPKANQEKQYGGQSNLGEPAGFLVLVQQTNSGIRFPDPEVSRQDPMNWPDGIDRNDDGDTSDLGEAFTIRTDQLGFFTPADRAESLTPGSTSRYDSDATALMQRVWYGHVARANLDGSIPANTEPGQPPAAATDDFDFSLATDLVLGRQGLLILDDQSLWPNGERVYNSSTGYNNQANNVLTAVAGDADGGAFDITERIDELEVDDVSDDYDALWKGAVDTVLLRDSQNANRDFSSFFEVQYDSISLADGIYAIGANFDNGTTNNGPIPQLRTSPRPGLFALDENELPTEFYARHALSWAFATPGQRLITTQDLNYPYRPEAVGRNHSFFVPYVSDFAVDFAADITDDYALADDPATPEPDNILLPWWDSRWVTWSAIDRFPPGGGDPIYRAASGFVPDGLPDGRPDEYVIIDDLTLSIADRTVLEVGVKWYSMSYDPNLTPPLIGANPIWVQATAGVQVRGEPIVKDRPATWRLPRNNPAATVGSQFPLGPFANALQIDGQYHSQIALTGAGTGITYPPYVGMEGLLPVFSPAYNSGVNVLAATAADYTAANTPSIESRAVFVFGHSTDFDMNSDDAITNELPGDGGSSTTDPVDGFEAGSAKWWPYALRIRYRLHDGDATYNSVGEIPSNAAGDEFEPMPGKWFEQIVPVPHFDNHRPELPL